MTDRPILFSAPMVRALLDGRKTQTRRMIKARGDCCLFDGSWSDSYVLDPGNAEWRARSIRFAVGDRLWVKETWRAHRAYDQYRPGLIGTESRIWYEADGRDNCDQHGKGRPSIFMPRWASRLTLCVTDVRVERLQACSEADALAEGAYRGKASGRIADNHAAMCLGDWFASARGWYADLWDRINGPGAWEANPWVVAVSFDVIKENIDG